MQTKLNPTLSFRDKAREAMSFYKTVFGGPGANMSMALGGDNDKDLTACFERLSAGGKVRQYLANAPWGETFGMLTDKFRIDWR